MKILFSILFFCCFLSALNCQSLFQKTNQLKAIEYLDQNLDIQQSSFWENVKPKEFINNLRNNILRPLQIYAGSNTNFCGYAAISYTCVNTDPLSYVTFMLQLYIEGFAVYGKVKFNPSSQVKHAAGILQFKGELDINGADQILFLSFADRFKGYLNLLNFHYKPGAENSLWPATNYAKFNRMLRKLTNFKVEALGTDLVRPLFFDITLFLQEKLLENDQVFLYLNNAILHKKNHQRIKFHFPTHYVVLFSIEEIDETIKIIYWDYGFKNQMILSKSVFIDLVFGVTWCKNKSNDNANTTQ